MKLRDYQKKLQLRNKEKLGAEPVSRRFPEVSRIGIRMTYFSRPGKSVYLKRSINISPASPAYFNMECMVSRGYDRGLDLTSVITDQIRRHKPLVKGEVSFPRQEAGPPSVISNITYEIRVRYDSDN